MSQQRNSGPATAANAIDEQRILDATYDLLISVGIRRMTMADIARHAEISRATLYRRWPNVQDVVATVVTREFSNVAAEALTRAKGDTVRERLVNGVVRIVAVAREHPMMRKIIDLDPEFLMPYLVKRTGRTSADQLTLLEQIIQTGIAEGSIRKDNVAALARAVLLTATSFTISGPVIAGRTSLSTLDNQLRLLLDRYLAP